MAQSFQTPGLLLATTSCFEPLCPLPNLLQLLLPPCVGGSKQLAGAGTAEEGRMTHIPGRTQHQDVLTQHQGVSLGTT